MPPELPPTKSALLYLRRQLRFIEQGHDMLERKRELLTLVVRDRLDYCSRRAWRRRRWPALTAGWASPSCAWAACPRTARGRLEPALAVSILPRSSVGVEYPTVARTSCPPAGGADMD
jgi:V/A-type H+-transporting ATPase subunit D